MSRSYPSESEPAEIREVRTLVPLPGSLRAMSAAIRKNALLSAAFLIPVAVLTVILYTRKIHPFGDYSPVSAEQFGTILPLLAEFRRKLLSADSLFFSWNIGYGVNFYAYIGMFLSSPLNLPVVFFPESAMPDLITLQILLRAGLSGLGFSLLLREKDQLRNAFLPALSSAYALGGFMLAYAREGYIADAVMLMPFVLLGAWRVIRGRRPVLYTVTLFLLIWSSWRAGIFIGLFLILMIPLLYMEAGGRHAEKTSRIPLGVRFALFSILAVAGAAVLLLPAWSAFYAEAGPFAFPDDLKMYFTFFDLGDRLLFRTVPELSRRIPNIYCGVAVMFLVPLFAFCDRIAFRERVYSLALVGFLYVAMGGSLIDYALNGFQMTERHHFMQAFLLSFLLLYMASRALRHAGAFSRRTIFIAVLGVMAFLVIDDHSGEQQRAWQAIYGTAVLIVLFAMCVRALSGPVLWHRVARSLFLLLMVTELTFTAIYAMDVQIRTQGLASYALHGRYAESVREGIEAATGTSRPVFRVSADTTFTDYDGALGGIMLPDAPVSALSADFVSYAQQNGFGDTNRSQLYAPVLSDVNGMLLGICGRLNFIDKTVSPDSGGPIGDYNEGVAEMPMPGTDPASRLAGKTVTHPADATGAFGSVDFTLNPYALPVAYRVDSGVLRPFDAALASSFDNSDAMLNLMGLEPLYVDKAYTTEDERNIVPTGDGRFSFVSQSASAFMLVRAIDQTAGERLFLSVDTDSEVRITVRISKTDGSAEVKTYNARRDRIIDCGAMTGEIKIIEAGVLFPAGGSEPFSLIVKGISQQAYEQTFRTLEKQSLRVGRTDGSGIRGSIAVEQDGVLFFSVPYEKGWSVRVDGKEIETAKAAGAWLSAPIKSGAHRVTARYTPPGFAVGLIVSLLAAMTFVTLNIWNPGRIMGLTKEKRVPETRSDG